MAGRQKAASFELRTSSFERVVDFFCAVFVGYWFYLGLGGPSLPLLIGLPLAIAGGFFAGWALFKVLREFWLWKPVDDQEELTQADLNQP